MVFCLAPSAAAGLPAKFTWISKFVRGSLAEIDRCLVYSRVYSYSLALFIASKTS